MKCDKVEPNVGTIYMIDRKSKLAVFSHIPNTTLKVFLYYLSRLKEELKIFNHSGVLQQQEDVKKKALTTRDPPRLIPREVISCS